MPGFRFFGVVFLAALPVLAQPCAAPPDVKAAIDAATLPPARPLEERAAAARKVRDQFPADYYAHRFYQEQYVSNAAFPVFAKPIQEEYKALLDLHPDDLMYQMLYARTLKGSNTKQAIAMLDEILARQPDYTLAHQKLTEIYSAPAFLDLPKLRMHLEAYWQGCPSSVAGYPLAGRIDDTDFVKGAAAHLRKLLESRTDNEALALYGTLWTLEFKSVPLAAQEPVRGRIREDVGRLRALDFEGRPFLLSELAQAYQVLGDKEGSKWVDERLPKRSLPAMNAAADTIMQWHRDHPFKPGEREAYQDELLQQTAEWVAQWPDEAQPRQERFMALRGSQDAPLEETVQAAQDWLRVYAAHPAFMSPYLQVAQFYAQHNMRYSELPDLLEKALAHGPFTQPAATPPGPVSDLFLPRSGPANAQSNYSALWEINSAAGIYIKIKHYDKAHEWLAKLGPPLMEAVKSATDVMKPQYGNLGYQYWYNMARLARIEGRKLDALEADRNAFFANTNTGAREYQKSALRDEWKAVKGTEEGFEEWATKPGETSPHPAAPAPAPTSVVANGAQSWTKLDKPLPDFEMSDAEGKTWRLADLKGKVTLINLWATWCGPCKAELPYLQKLFNKVRERQDLTVLTLNTDDNVGLILPFLQENKYTFPVLAADAYVHKLVPELSIPRNWIVDPNGVLRMERIGFGNGSDQWVDEMIAAMEKARQ
ncbi:MAG: redoxin domain-containing protein [Bryobacteraceae bacterium]